MLIRDFSPIVYFEMTVSSFVIHSVLSQVYNYSNSKQFCKNCHFCQRFTISSDGPQTPLNLTVNSDKKGNVNMTWVSGFNEGLDQFFVISRKNGKEWEYVGNLSDLGEGSVMYFEAGTLTSGQNNYFRLETCNMFNCTAQYVEPDANLKGMLYFFLKCKGGV